MRLDHLLSKEKSGVAAPLAVGSPAGAVKVATGCAADAFVAPLATCSFSPWLSGLDGRFLSAAGRRKYRHLDKCIVVRLPMSVSEAEMGATKNPAGSCESAGFSFQAGVSTSVAWVCDMLVGRVVRRDKDSSLERR